VPDHPDIQIYQHEQRIMFQAIGFFDLHQLETALNKIDTQRSLTIFNLRDDKGFTLLHKAASSNSSKIVEYLVSFLSRRYSQHLK
jgi:ankyrin repeat protein